MDNSTKRLFVSPKEFHAPKPSELPPPIQFFKNKNIEPVISPNPLNPNQKEFMEKLNIWFKN